MEKNNLYTGDSLELLKSVTDNSIDLHFTSPPYADMKVYDNSIGIHPDRYVEWFIPFIKEIERTLNPNGSFILNINDKIVNKVRHPYVFDLISEIHKQTNLKMFERCFWDKRKCLSHSKRFGDRVEFLFWFIKSEKFYIDMNAMRKPYNPISIKRMEKPLKRRYNRTEQNQDAAEYKAWSPNPLGALPSVLIEISSESKRVSNTHTAVFPEKLCEYFIKGASKKNDLICDIFSGSGTTCTVAKKLGRNYLGFDSSAIYNKEAELRILNY